MAAIAARDINEFLKNPFSLYVADVGDSQPATPSFYTGPEQTFNFNREFVEAQAYPGAQETGKGILYTVRKEIQSFNFVAELQIKEFNLEALQLTLGGTLNTAGNTITFDGTDKNYAFWFESCYSSGVKDGKLIRIIVPTGRSVESVSLGTAAGFENNVPLTIEALPDISDSTTLPQIYIEQ